MRKLYREAEASTEQEDTKAGHQTSRSSAAFQPRQGLRRRRTDGEKTSPVRSPPLPDLRSLEISGSLAREDRHIRDPNFCPSPLRPKRRGTPFVGREQQTSRHQSATQQSFEQASFTVPRNLDRNPVDGLSSPRQRPHSAHRSLTSPASVPALRREDAFESSNGTGSDVFMDRLDKVSKLEGKSHRSDRRRRQGLGCQTPSAIGDRQTTYVRGAEVSDVFMTPKQGQSCHETLRVGKGAEDVVCHARQSDIDELNFNYEEELEPLGVPLRTESPFVGQKLSFDHMFGPVLSRSSTEEEAQHAVRGHPGGGPQMFEHGSGVDALPAANTTKTKRPKNGKTPQSLAKTEELKMRDHVVRHQEDPIGANPQTPMTPTGPVEQGVFFAPQTPPQKRALQRDPALPDAVSVRRTPRSTDRSRVLSTIAEAREDSPDSPKHRRGMRPASDRMPAVVEESPEVLSPAQALERELELLESQGNFPSGGRSRGHQASPQQKTDQASAGIPSDLF